MFGADNSGVEWRFSRYDVGNGNEYAIGARHDEYANRTAIHPDDMGFGRANEIASIHSHPGSQDYSTTMQEYGSMGWKEGGYLSVPSDSWNVKTYSSQYPSYNNSYVYFPNSGNIHRPLGHPQPQYIRNIRGHNYNGQRLFWGVLNGR